MMPIRDASLDCARRRRTGAIVRAAFALTVGVAAASPVAAEITLRGRGVLFYTDDVGIFSATRRLSRDGDPTQPAIDAQLANQGSDVVFEPDLTLSTSRNNRWGTLTLNAQGQGFMYTDHARFNHGTLRLEALQAFSPETKLRLRFYYAPDLFLGDNENRQPGATGLTEEVVSSYIWSARLERNLTPEFEVRLLTRYGLRRYNADFEQRNTDFWTIGPHLEWRVAPRVKVGVSYHYERGLADGRNQPQLKDDVSYVNHYGSADVEVELTKRVSFAAGFHYERNNWTSGIPGDERQGAHENILQGDAVVYYRLADKARVGFGVQRSSRKQSFESSAVTNTNVGFGIEATF
jgi:hypothetical protein